jgi:hypothetical protein
MTIHTELVISAIKYSQKRSYILKVEMKENVENKGDYSDDKHGNYDA